MHHAPQPLGQPDDLGVVGDALLEVACLADIERLAAGIEHPVDARALRHGRERALDYLNARDSRDSGRGFDIIHGR